MRRLRTRAAVPFVSAGRAAVTSLFSTSTSTSSKSAVALSVPAPPRARSAALSRTFRVSLPSWPSTMSPRPAPGSSVSSPSPPKYVVDSSPPVNVSLPEPASATTAISAPRPGPVVSVSLPPNVFSSNTSLVATSSVNGAFVRVVVDLATDDAERGDVVGGAEVVLDPVEAVVAVHLVVAVAVVPDQRVVAGVAVHGVVAGVAEDAVAAGAAVERVDARAALDEVGAVTGGDGVVAGAGVDRRRDRRAGGAGERVVVARERVDVQALRARGDVDDRCWRRRG